MYIYNEKDYDKEKEKDNKYNLLISLKFSRIVVFSMLWYYIDKFIRETDNLNEKNFSYLMNLKTNLKNIRFDYYPDFMEQVETDLKFCRMLEWEVVFRAAIYFTSVNNKFDLPFEIGKSISANIKKSLNILIEEGGIKIDG